MKRSPRLRDLLLTIALNAVNAPPAPFFYGGQAVVEGVLMRGRRHFAVAARRPDGTVIVYSDLLRQRMYNSRFWSLPFFRGVAGLVEMLHLGMRALQWSVRVQLGEEVQISSSTMRVAMAGSFVFAIALFIGAPLGISALLHRAPVQSVTGVLIEGGIRAAILIAYLLLIGQLPNIRRLFEYHGAEHKSINTLENEEPIDVAHVQRNSRLHPRCGTGFIVVVALVSIVVFAPLGVLQPALRIACQIALVPVVAAISYEVIRALARIRHTRVGRIALAPILSAQLLSTREPDASQIEVAIRALDAARAVEPTVGELVETP
ncbi:MAG: DUF1385 domain-containing protein [Candidatus Dormibacteraeota bacterium]|nr:DUF1385 domain-containing protein [Candidatus Dormibacteraeota bacterium]